MLYGPIMHFPAPSTRYSWRNIKNWLVPEKKKKILNQRELTEAPSLHPQSLRLGFQQHIQCWQMAHTPLPTNTVRNKDLQSPKEIRFPLP